MGESELMALTKADLAAKLIEDLGMNKPDAKLLVDQFFSEIKASLELGQAVKLTGFGSYQLREKKQRPGRNPKTGEEIPVTARRVVTFKPGQKLKTQVSHFRGQTKA
jgi:integration host factor subunit alpha